MEVENAYFKRIIYKKNALTDLKTYVKLNYTNKKILLVSSKSVSAEDVTMVLNSLFFGTEAVGHFVFRNNFKKNELDNLGEKISAENYDLIVVLGSGKCCDVVKFFSFKYKLPYVVCPTVATSLSYFSNFCINPYNSCESFYAKMPKKIFIQESFIKKSTCYANINGLCFLNAIRSVYLEGLINNDEKYGYVFVGLGKLFKRLEEEQENILICDEDSNLVLMDLFIDFGFFLAKIDKENYYLFNMYCLYNFINDDCNEFCGRGLLLCCNLILNVLKRYLEINSVHCFEKPNYYKLKKIMKKYNIFDKKIKNNEYFCNLFQKTACKDNIEQNASCYYKWVVEHLYKIDYFLRKVKNVYKFGVELEADYEKLFHSLALSSFLRGNNILVDYIAGCGIMNSLIANV